MYEFFKKLYEIEEISQAFKIFVLDKLKNEGYCDLSPFINKKYLKAEILEDLKKENSPYFRLYKQSTKELNENNAFETWISNTIEVSDRKLSKNEAKAIIDWIYRIFKKNGDNEEFSSWLSGFLMKTADFQGERIRYNKGFLFNTNEIELKFVTSISEVLDAIESISVKGKKIYYRGHADTNYKLSPSIMRPPERIEFEDKFYNEIMINCPQDFANCHTHIEKLVKMQHYGIPTRLMDITSNPLVALYFACNEQQNLNGELIIISTEDKQIKYPSSDTVSILASLAPLSFSRKGNLYWAAKTYYGEFIPSGDSKELMAPLLQEIRTEKPAFRLEFKPEDLVESCIVQAVKSNMRIIRQDGAFILCGLIEDVPAALEIYRAQRNNKKIIVIIENKEKIMGQLELLSVNQASLMPEIEEVAKYLVKEYS